MDLLCFRGRAVDLLFGTSQLSVPWQTLVFHRLPEKLSVAELAATKKEDKYSGLAADYLFQPIAVETLGPINESASDFFSVLAKKISHHSGDERKTAFCSRVQRFNGVLLHNTFALRTSRNNGHSDNFLLIFFFKPLGIIDTEGLKT